MKVILYLLLINCLLLLTGCWDAVELEEQAYVVAMGFDTAENGYISLTYQIANPQVGSSQLSEAQKEPPFSIITMTVPDAISAKDLANVSVSRRINYSQMKVIFYSEEFARSEKFLDTLEMYIREPQIDRLISVVVTKEKSADFIKKNKPPMETRPHKNYEFMTERYKDTGLMTLSNIDRLLRNTAGDNSAFLAIYATATEMNPAPPNFSDNYLPGEVPKEGDNPSQFIGSAVLFRGKMIGTMTGFETRLALNIRPHSKAKNWLEAFEDPLEKGKFISTRVEKFVSPKIKLDTKGDHLKIDVDLHLKLEVFNITSYINYVTDFKNQQLLIDSMETYLEEQTTLLIKKSQEEWEADIFNWGNVARKKFWTLNQYTAYNWKEKYPKAEIHVKYVITIKQFGKAIDPIDVEKIKED